MSGRTREDFLNFLDYLGEKGIINPATASSRKASANKILAILSDEDAQDVTSLNLDDVISRFSNLHRSQYTADSLQTYRSRLKTSLEDFNSYCSNPLSFKPLTQARRAKPARAAAKPTSNDDSTIQPVRVAVTPLQTTQILPIAIRADVTVQVAGLPFDLTAAEAKKISGIIMAHASVE